MAMSTLFIVDPLVVDEADPLIEAQNQIAVLQLQAARLKQDRDDLRESVISLELQAKERAILVRNVMAYWIDAEEEIVDFERGIEELRGLIRILQEANAMLSSMAGFVEIPVPNDFVDVAWIHASR